MGLVSRSGELKLYGRQKNQELTCILVVEIHGHWNPQVPITFYLTSTTSYLAVPLCLIYPANSHRNQRYTISTETFPVPNAAAGAKVLSKIQKHWFNITDSVIDVPGVIGSLALQPLSRKVAQKAKERGGVRSPLPSIPILPLSQKDPLRIHNEQIPH